MHWCPSRSGGSGRRGGSRQPRRHSGNNLSSRRVAIRVRSIPDHTICSPGDARRRPTLKHGGWHVVQALAGTMAHRPGNQRTPRLEQKPQTGQITPDSRLAGMQRAIKTTSRTRTRLKLALFWTAHRVAKKLLISHILRVNHAGLVPAFDKCGWCGGCGWWTGRRGGELAGAARRVCCGSCVALGAVGPLRPAESGPGIRGGTRLYGTRKTPHPGHLAHRPR
jgi:hypothetical protein